MFKLIKTFIFLIFVSSIAYSDLTKHNGLNVYLDSSDTAAIKVQNSSGTVIFNVDTTGAITTMAGGLTLAGSITLANAEVISNTTDDTVRIASEDSSTIAEVYSPNTSNGTASIILNGDAGADATDRYRIQNDAAGNLNFGNDISVAGTYVNLFRIASGGIAVLGPNNVAAYITLSADNSDDNGDDWQIINTTANVLEFITDAPGSQVTKFSFLTNGGIVFEGATDDASEGTLSPSDVTADRTWTLPDSTGAVLVSSLTTNAIGAANSIYGSSNELVFEGTADAFQTRVTASDATADQTVNIPNFGVNTAFIMSTLVTNTISAANSIWAGSSNIEAEGSSANDFETVIQFVDPTADQTISVPNNAANSSLFTSALTTNAVDVANSVWGISNGISFEGTTADAFETTVSPADPTADRTVTLPDQTGTVMLSGVATALTPGAAVTLTVAPGNRLYTDTIVTDNQDQTINASGAGAAGDEMTIIFVTDGAGSNDEVITFGTNMRSTGTLTLANAAASRYVVTFISDGGKWNELSRTAVQAA